MTSNCGEEHFTVETLGSKFDFSKIKDNKVTVKGEVQAEVFYYGCEYDLNKGETLDKLSKITEETIKEYVSKSIVLAQKNKTDFIGVGNWIYKNKNSYFDFENDNWDSLGLPNLEFDYDIKVKLMKQGNLKGDI